MSDLEVAKEITAKLTGGRFVELRVIVGHPNTFMIVLEGQNEAMGSISFQPSLDVEIMGGKVQIIPKQNISVDSYKK